MEEDEHNDERKKERQKEVLTQTEDNKCPCLQGSCK
jgi:hypothetical protein